MKVKLTSGFIGPKLRNVERSLNLSAGPLSSLVWLVKFLLEALPTEAYGPDRVNTRLLK